MKRAVRTATVTVAVVAVVVVIRLFLIVPYTIESGSMAPTISTGDHVVASRVSLMLGPIHRGDIVVFNAPLDLASACGSANASYLVKRIVGLPGEHLYSRGGYLFVNGKVLRQPWAYTHNMGVDIPVGTVVPVGAYYVLGDNRAQSCDSRYYGVIPRAAIFARVYAAFWPLSHLGLL